MEAARPRFEVLPAAVSVVPGLLLHGMGPLVAGDTRTAARHFLLEGSGLGLLIAGGVPIAMSGASRRVIGPLYAVTLAGVGLFSISTLSNLYGALAPAFPPGEVPQREREQGGDDRPTDCAFLGRDHFHRRPRERAG